MLRFLQNLKSWLSNAEIRNLGESPSLIEPWQDGMTRRNWLLATSAAFATMTVTSRFAEGLEKKSDSDVYARFPSQAPDVVAEVVRVSHFDLNRVRELVAARPALAKSAWDWGFGDWETAIGAASHMGRRDMAELLIAHGAHPDLFTFAMLGHLEVVQACVEASPGIQRIVGPHGITLLQHARKGGEQAKSVVEYLISVGDADVGQTSLKISQEEQEVYVGRYRFGVGSDDILDVLVNRRGNLAIKRGKMSARTIHRIEDHAFAPAGAAQVRIRFEVGERQAVALTVEDPTLVLTAHRLPK